MSELTRHTESGYSGIACACLLTGCSPGPMCHYWSRNCREHIAHERAMEQARALDAELAANTPRRGEPAPLPDEEKNHG
jgi:hypothetical protein